MNFDVDLVGETFVKIKTKNLENSLKNLCPFIIKKSIDSICGPAKL